MVENQNGGLKESVQNVKVGMKEKPNNLVTEQEKVKPSKTRNGKETIVIAGDSILKGQIGWLMLRQKNIQFKAFSRSTCSDMDHHLNPFILRKPDCFFLHVGTNFLTNYSPDEVANMIRNLAIKVRNNNINCHASSLIMRVDKPDLNEKVEMEK